MKLRFFIYVIFFVITSSSLFSLSNFDYWGIAFNGSGDLLASQTVTVNIQIINSSGVVYEENHTGVSTNQFGAYSVTVGTGTVVSGNLSNVAATKDMKIKSTVNNSGTWVVSSFVKLNTAVTGGGSSSSSSSNLTDGAGIADFTYNGSSDATVSIDYGHAGNWTAPQTFNASSGYDAVFNNDIDIQGNIENSGGTNVLINDNFLPAGNNLNLGSSTHRWKELYLSGTSLHIGSITVGSTTYKGEIGFSTISSEPVFHFNDDIYPSSDNAYNLGSAGNKWKDIHATTFHGALSGNATTATNIAGGTNGSLPYQTGANTTTMLAPGTNGQVLTLVGGVPTWTTSTSSGWGLTGNAGTTQGTNFLGTTDGVALELRIENSQQTNNSFVLNSNGSIQHDNPSTPGIPGVSGNARGQNAIDLQPYRSSASQIASGTNSVLGGGINNTASGSEATVSGGKQNVSGAICTTIGGGSQNHATGDYSTISGGAGNSANAKYASMGGGENNAAGGDHSTISGGRSNQATASYATVGGGRSNQATGFNSTIAGGIGNSASFEYTVVGGGYNNQATAGSATVSGGKNNTASSNESTIGGGGSNQASAIYSTIAGGNNNSATRTSSTVGGGENNTASGKYATVPGGYYNTAPSYAETVIGVYATNYTPTSATTFNSSDRLFNVGNGTGASSRSDAFTIYKNGNAKLNGKLTINDVMKLTPRSSAPSSPSTGDMYMDDGTNTSDNTPKLMVYNGTTWKECW